MCLEVLVGKDLKGKEVNMELGALTLISGGVGKGKTTLIKNIIDELQGSDNKVDITVCDICGMDYLYTNVNTIQNVKELEDLLNSLIDLIATRRDLFLSRGCKDIEEYNNIIKECLEYKVLVIENYELVQDLIRSRTFSSNLEYVITAGNCFGISVILSSQKDRGSRSLMASATNLIEFPSIFNGYLAKELGLELNSELTNRGTFILLNTDGNYKIVNGNTKEEVVLSELNVRGEGLSVVVGKDSRGRDVYLNLDMPVLMSGMAGSGKTNATLNMINEIKRNYNADISVIAKNCYEFEHIKEDVELVNIGSGATDCFTSLLKELQDRKDLIHYSNCKGFKEYNLKNIVKLPYKVVFIDDILVYSEDSKEMYDNLNLILSQGRALGVSIVMNTQDPKRLNRAIYGNVNTSLYFRDVYDLDSVKCIKKVAYLDRGECIVSKGNVNVLVQVPLNKKLM